jgi:hypothetical protein
MGQEGERDCGDFFGADDTMASHWCIQGMVPSKAIFEPMAAPAAGNPPPSPSALSGLKYLICTFANFFAFRFRRKCMVSTLNELKEN